MKYISEFFGMMMLILLNNGAVANTKLNGSGMKNENSALMICIASGLAVFIPLYIFHDYCGAHFNPAVTIALALTGQFPVSMIIPYILCQLTGAFCGACLVWVLYKEHFNITEDGNVKRSIFCTSPSIRHTASNLLSEIVGTFILTFAIACLRKSCIEKQSCLFVFAVITSIGMSFGGLTGFAINPARDFGPRLAYGLLPIKNKKNDWGYCWIPVVGPILGSLVTTLIYYILPW